MTPPSTLIIPTAYLGPVWLYAYLLAVPHCLEDRGSHFYLALYWSQALAAQKDDAELAAKFAPVAKALAENEQKIVAAFANQQGKPADIGGYYLPKPELLKKWMRPVAEFNAVIDAL